MDKEKIDGRYDYFAFISYTEENTEKAQDLKKDLTHYRFPKDVREERTDLPSWIRPVFEWKTDTSGGDLRGKDSQIKKALFNSKYLIVICSPQAVTSEPVNGEIQDFINWGREKYIIPFIIDGQPHAVNPEEECFPPALFELEGDRERKGIFIDNINEDYAVNSVVSTMFNIKVNDLWKPYEREQRRRRDFILGGVILAALVFFSAGVYFYMLNKDNKKLREISDEQLSHIREDSIKLREHIYQIQQDSAIKQRHLFQIQQDSARLVEKSDSIRKQALALLNTNTELSMKNRALALSQMRLLCEKIVDYVSEENLDAASQSLGEVKNLYKSYKGVGYIEELDFALRELDKHRNRLVKYVRTIKKGPHQEIFYENKDYYVSDGDCLTKYNLSSEEKIGKVFPPDDTEVWNILDINDGNVKYISPDSKRHTYDLKGGRDVIDTEPNDSSQLFITVNRNGTYLRLPRPSALDKDSRISQIVGDSLFIHGYNSLKVWSIKKNRMLSSFTVVPPNEKALYKISFIPFSGELLITPLHRIEGNGYVLPLLYKYDKCYENDISFITSQEGISESAFECELNLSNYEYKIKCTKKDGSVTVYNEIIENLKKKREKSMFSYWGFPYVMNYDFNRYSVVNPEGPYIFLSNGDGNCSLIEFMSGKTIWSKTITPWSLTSKCQFTKDNHFMIINNQYNDFVYSLPTNLDYRGLITEFQNLKYDYVCSDGQTAVGRESNNGYYKTNDYFFVDYNSERVISKIFSKTGIRILAISDDKRFIAYYEKSDDNQEIVSVFDAISHQIDTIPRYFKVTTDAKFCKDGSTIVIKEKDYFSKDKEIAYVIYNLNKKQKWEIITTGDSNEIFSLSPKGNEVVFTTNQRHIGREDLCILELSEHDPPLFYDISEPSGSPTCAKFSQDGKKIIAGYKDGTIRIWNNLYTFPSNVSLFDLPTEVVDVDINSDEVYALAIFREPGNLRKGSITKGYYATVWHVPSGKVIYRYPIENGPFRTPNTACFSIGNNPDIIVNNKYTISFPIYKELINRYMKN